MPYLVADLEMSGPDPGYHEIIQLGAVLLLKSISSFFAMEREGDTHNALEDAELTMLCLQRFFKIAANTKISMNGI